MPFKSEKQRRFLWAEHPDIAKRWAQEYPESNRNLPMYADSPDSDSKKKDAEEESQIKKKAASFLTELKTLHPQIDMNKGAYVNNCNFDKSCSHSRMPLISTKIADSKQERVEVPHSEEPTYAGEEREKGMTENDISLAKNVSGDNAGVNKRQPENAINSLLQKISVVLAPAVEQTMENLQAEREGRVPRRVGKNRGIKQYPVATPTIPLPLGMQQPPSNPVPANHDHYANSGKAQPVGGGSNPMANPINAFGAISMTGNINGNAAFGAKNSPDSSKIAAIIKRASKSDALAKLMSMDAVDPTDVDYYNEEYEEELAGRKAASADSGPKPKKPRNTKNKGGWGPYLAGAAAVGLPAALIAAKVFKYQHLNEQKRDYDELHYGTKSSASTTLQADPLATYEAEMARQHGSPAHNLWLELSGMFDDDAESGKHDYNDPQARAALIAKHKQLMADEQAHKTFLNERATFHANADNKLQALLKGAAADALEHDLPAEKKPTQGPSLLTTGLVGAGAGLGAFGLSKALEASGYSPGKLVQPYLPAAPEWLKNLGTKLEDYMTPKSAKDNKTPANTPCSCGCGDTVTTCKCSSSCSCKKPGGSCYKPTEKESAMKNYTAEDVIKIARCWAGYEPVPGKAPYSEDSCRPVGSGKKKKKKEESKSEKKAGTPAWQRSEGKNEEGGLNEKGRKSYEREHGGNLKAPVTQKNPKGEAKKRQNSFCSRMCGMKRVNTGSKTKNDPDSRINKSLRKWNCKCSSAREFGEKLAGSWGNFLTGALKSTVNTAGNAAVAHASAPVESALAKPAARSAMGATLFPSFAQRKALGQSAMGKIMGK